MYLQVKKNITMGNVTNTKFMGDYIIVNITYRTEREKTLRRVSRYVLCM